MGGLGKNVFQNQKCLTKKLSVTHVFTMQIFRAIELAPPPPSPHRAVHCAGGGVVVALFCHKQWLWLWL
jgi:hypothetical protein